jgi:type III secretory pathway component EscT
MSQLAQWLEPLAPRAAAAALHGLRLLPAALLCPFMGGPLVPSLVRLALAFGLGACAWSGAGGAPFEGGEADLLGAAARELALGTALGLLAAVPFEAARAGGRLVDTLRGATLAELHVAPLRQRESATGDLLVQWMVVLAANAGGGRLVVSALLETFRAVPLGGVIAPSVLLETGLRGAAELLACALALGAPAAAGVLAADLAVSLASRAAPRLSIAPAAQPARAALGLLAVAVPAAALAGRLTSAVALSAGLLRSIASGRPP